MGSSAVLPTALPSPPFQWAVRIGAAGVVLGGLVAAVTGPLSLPRGSWLAAYLVLVVGVSQYTMGRVSTWFGVGSSDRIVWSQLIGWNCGNTAVVVGTLITMPYLVDVGGVVLLIVLLTLLRDALRRRPIVDVAPTSRRLGRRAYTFLLIALVVSVPIGLALAHLRAG